MDVPHHWEGWVVGEELGSLSNDGDADCPVDISIYCLSSILCFFFDSITLHRHPLDLDGTWQMMMGGKRILHSQ